MENSLLTRQEGNMQGDTQTIRDGLRDVIDFEIGLDVVALGMIRAIDVTEDNVTITMILTSPMCPMASFMMNQVRERAAELVDQPVQVVMGREMWHPDMMEQEARDALGI
jgi:metal-sulfur cluster biosynthetic enzyme